AHLLHHPGIQQTMDDFLTWTGLSYDFTPGVYDCGMSPGLIGGLMVACRGAGKNISLIVHRPAAHEQVPVQGTGSQSECGRHDRQVGTEQNGQASYLRKADVVTD